MSNTEGMLQRAAEWADAGEPEKAHALLSLVIRDKPEEPRAAYILGNLHLKANRPETAYFLFRYIQKFPEFRVPMVFNAIGHCLSEMGQFEESEHWFLEAIGKSAKANGPQDTATSCASLASIYTKKGDPQKAVDMAEKALSLNPDCQEAKWNGSLALLKLRQWKQGWEWYDALLQTKLRPKPPALNDVILPTWEGKGGNVLVYGEQGLGDEIMFASMLPDAVKNADRVICAVDPRLIGLLQRSFPDVVFTSRRSKDIVLPEPIDVTHTIALGSLGRLFRNADSEFPGTRYLKPDPTRCVMYRALLADLGAGKKIGVMWKGGVGGLDENERTLNLHDLEPLLSQDAVFVSLSHLPEAKAECDRFYDQTGLRVHHFPFITQSNDYDDAAALISQLDATVCMTGTAAHCAAALGVNSHVLVPKMPYWRYLHTGSTMPWYRSMTMHRQTDKWPVEEVRDALR
jgi:tetratricopeptide (TPR) repeat protein